jgi:hypothetical protein
MNANVWGIAGSNDAPKPSTHLRRELDRCAVIIPVGMLC